MSARRWIRRQLDRPTAEHERRTIALCGLILVVTIAGLVLTNPARPTGVSGRQKQTTAAAINPGGNTPPPWSRAAEAAANATAETFLRGYLAYLYGHAPASQVGDATESFVRSLEPGHLQVPPGIRALRPRVVSLDVSQQGAGRVLAVALVSDAEVVHYPIRLVLTESARRWQVSGLEATP
jgi:hypothetical protein